MLTLKILLGLILKGAITGAGSKAGQAVLEKLKEKFGKSLGEKVGAAFIRASEICHELGYQDIDPSLVDDPYYETLLYSFNAIDGSDLLDDDKLMNKLFLEEIFKIPELRDQVFNKKLDDIYQDVKEIKAILQKDTVNYLSAYSRDRFLSEYDFSDYPQYYIARQMAISTDRFRTEISSFNDLMQYYYKYKKENKPTPLRALIIADGGVGKSIYLKYLAQDCSGSEQYYPVFVSLRDLKPTDILQDYIERRFPEFKKIEAEAHSQLCFFLDGFDEIGDSSLAIKQINDFCCTYSESLIVLTSRRNSFSNQLPDFTNDFIFTLLDLTPNDIAKYIHTKYTSQNIDTDYFFEQVSENNLNNLLFNPFYLNALVDYYIKNDNTLRVRKKELIENLLFERIEQDKRKRPDLELDKPPVRLKILKLAKQFAFAQALMDQRSVSDKDMVRVFSEVYDLAIQCLPIKKGSFVENEQHWEFEHNIFLEHFVSDVLKELGINKIIEYASFEKKIKSKWRDIISHLLGILDTNKEEDTLFTSFVDWLIENDSEILLKIEDSQLSQEVRSQVFLQIYKYYQEKTIWLNVNGINIEQMARWGESKENVNHVFGNIINSGEHYRRRINATFVFRYFKLNQFTDREKAQMGKQYMDVLYKLESDDDEYKERLESYFISNFPFQDQNLLDQLIKHYHSTSSSEIISNILHLIEVNNLQDKYIETIINFLIKIGKRQTTGNFYMNAYPCLLKMNEESFYIKYFTSHLDEDLYYETMSYHRDEFKQIVQNCSIYSSDELIKLIISLSSKQAFWGSSTEWEIFAPFFENEEKRKRSITLLLEPFSSKVQDEMRYWRLNCTLARIVKIEDLPQIFETIDNRDLYIDVVRYSVVSDVQERVLEYLKSKYNYEPVPYTDPWAERSKNEFDILFEKDRFQEECFALFDELGDTFVPSELYKVEMKGKYWNRLIIYFMNWFVGKKEITKTQLETWFVKNSDYFDFYLNMKICNKLPHWNTNAKMPDLSDVQLTFIKAYYDKHINDAPFHLTIKHEEKNTCSVSSQASVLIKYMERFEFECPDHKLCEMLGNFNANFSFITKKISDKNILESCILDNLKNYTEFIASRILDMCKYCVDHKIHQALSAILDIIKDSDFDKYQKSNLIRYCVEKETWVEDIINVSSFLTQSEILDFCEELLQKYLLDKKSKYSNKETITQFLYQIIDKPENEENKLHAISLLVWLKEEKALQLLIDYCKEHSVLALDDAFNGFSVGNRMSDNYLEYEDIKLLPLLMELLEFSLTPEMLPQNSRHNKIERNLIHLVSLSTDNYIEVKLTLEEFIENNKGKYRDVESLNFTINKIEELHKEQETKRYTIREALDICKQEID